MEDWIPIEKISTFERESSIIIVTASSREKDEEDSLWRRRKDDGFRVLPSFTAAFAAVLLLCYRVGTTTTTENGDLSTKAGKRRSVQSRRLRVRPGGQLGRPFQQRRLGDDESTENQSLVFGHATASRKEKE